MGEWGFLAGEDIPLVPSPGGQPMLCNAQESIPGHLLMIDGLESVRHQDGDCGGGSEE